MKALIKSTALAFAASGMVLTASPAAAADFHDAGYSDIPSHDGWNRHRRNHIRVNKSYSSYTYNGVRYADAEPVYRDTRVWRGEDGRTYCRKKDGTTGLIIGGAAGALVGREVDGGRDRSLGTVLGAAAGALLGREVDGHGVRCG